MASRNRRFFTVHQTTADRARQLAKKAGKSTSGMVREWIEEYAKDYIEDVHTPIEATKVDMQVVVDPEIAAQAERIARHRGTTLRDVIEDRILNT